MGHAPGMGLARHGSWGLYFQTFKDIGQVTKDINPADVILNNFVAGATISITTRSKRMRQPTPFHPSSKPWRCRKAQARNRETLSSAGRASLLARRRFDVYP